MAAVKSDYKPTPTATRVEERTNPKINQRIKRDTEVNLARAAVDKTAIERRLRELDQEWDIEHVLQTNFSVINLLSATLGALVARPWFLLTGIAATFMSQHAWQGWCPPIPILRRIGFRTAREIAQERYALKVLRGDFQGADAQHPAKAFAAAATGSRFEKEISE
jgi:hypothetical protein